MKNRKFFQNGGMLCVAAAGLTAMILLALAALLKIWPFGDISLAFWDGNWQYIDYLAYFREVLLGERSLWYSMSITLGGNMSAINGYYLLSPFNFLVLFFEKAEMPMAFTLISMVKIIMCSVCFQVFLNQWEETKTNWLSIVFSAIYALSGYVFVYGYNYMWLDGVMALPLVAAGIHRMLRDKKTGLYIFGIAYGLITCYYVGCMLCIFSVLYFGVQWVCERRKDVFLRYVIASLLAGGISACVLLPVFMALGNTEAEQTSMQVAVALNFDLKEFCSAFFLKPFVEADLSSSSLPPIFCGAGSLYFAVAFFGSGRIEKREKIQYAVLLLMVLLSMWINILNMVWHGFREPTGCPYRYSFVFVFLLLACAARGCQSMFADDRNNAWSVHRRILPALVCLAMVLVAYCYGKTEFKYAAVSVCLILASAGIACVKAKGIVLLAMAVVLLADVFHGGKIVWLQTTRYEDSTISTYREYVTELSELVAEYCDSTENLTRMEILPESRRSYSDAMVYNYPGISFYSSAEDTVVEEWLANMGIAHWRENYSNGNVLDSLLGVRYRVGEITLENETAFPLIWSASQIEMLSGWQGENAAEELNRIYRAIDPNEESVLEPAAVAWDGKEGTVWSAEVIISEPGEYAVAVDLTADGERPYTEIHVNGQRLGFYSYGYTPLYICIGTFEAGEKVELEVRFHEEVTNCQLYHENKTAFENVVEEVSLQGGQLFKEESTFSMKLSGTVSTKADQDITIAIPYNSGWRATVDGVECDTYRAFGIFLGIEAEEGVHQVELTFCSPGLWVGLLISVTCMLCVIGLSMYQYKKNKVEE